MGEGIVAGGGWIVRDERVRVWTSRIAVCCLLWPAFALTAWSLALPHLTESSMRWALAGAAALEAALVAAALVARAVEVPRVLRHREPAGRHDPYALH